MVLRKTKRCRSASIATSRTLQALDVGGEQWRRVGQVGAGVDDAVEHHVPVGHRRRHRIGVEDIPVTPFDVETLDALGRTTPPQQHPHVIAPLD